MAVVTLAFGVCGWIGSSISLGSLMARHKRDNMGVFMSQVAGGFVHVFINDTSACSCENPHL